MMIKRKKMNVTMMILTDCISLENLSKELIEFINYMGEIIELRAVAYKDLSSSQKTNNLYNFWHIWKTGQEDPDLSNQTMKVEFYKFIEEQCRQLINRYNIKS